MIPINLFPMSDELVEITKDVIQILNANQNAFEYKFIDDTQIMEELKKYEYFQTDTLYPHFEKLRIRLAGYNPYILGITSKRVGNLKYKNLFGDLQKHNGISLGNGVITTFQVQEIIKDIPIEAYLLYEVMLCPLLVITRMNLFHEEKRICPFDRKIYKTEIYEVLKHSTLCLACSKKIKTHLDRNQLVSMRRVFPLIDDLSNGMIKVSELVKRKRNEIRVSNENEISISKIKRLIGEDKLREAIDQMADYLDLMNSSNKDEIIILQSRFSRLTRQERLNIISRADLNIGKSQIATDLLEIIEEISRI